jgi:hypothetical protein
MLGIKIKGLEDGFISDGNDGFGGKWAYTWCAGVWWKPIQVNPKDPSAIMPRPMYDIHKEIYWNLTNGWATPPGHKGRKHHFMEMVKEVFGYKEATWFFEWNPNAEAVLEEKMNGEKWVMVAGHASSAKTTFMVLWGVMNYLMDPWNTKVIVTSTTLKQAKRKIWAEVDQCWHQVIRHRAKTYGISREEAERQMPGKFMADGIIKYRGEHGETDAAGMEVIAGDASNSKETVEKIQGSKRKRIFVLLEELASLESALVNTVTGNLMANTNCDVMGAFNPDSHYDEAGKASEPVDGWSSITQESTRWRNKRGVTLRFDGKNSPNVVLGYEKWKGLLTRAAYERAENELGPDSKIFWSQYRGYWSPTGSLECVFSEAEIEQYHAEMPITNEWISPPKPCGFMDASFEHGGDRAFLVIGKCGDAKTPAGIRRVLSYTHLIHLDADINKKEDKSEQIVEKFIAECKIHGIEPEHAGFDVTGASSLYSLIKRDWSDKVLAVKFGEVASDQPLSRLDQRLSKDEYSRKSDEIWYAAKPLIRSHQLKGFHPDVIKDMVSRTFKRKNGKIQMETKDEMKSRGLRSPDRGDSALGLGFLCRQRMGLMAEERSADKGQNGGNKSFQKAAKAMADMQTPVVSFSGGGGLWD